MAIIFRLQCTNLATLNNTHQLNEIYMFEEWFCGIAAKHIFQNIHSGVIQHWRCEVWLFYEMTKRVEQRRLFGTAARLFCTQYYYLFFLTFNSFTFQYIHIIYRYKFGESMIRGLIQILTYISAGFVVNCLKFNIEYCIM